METEQRRIGIDARLAPKPLVPPNTLQTLPQERNGGSGVGGVCRPHGEAGEHTWCLYPLIVVGVHADLVFLHVEGELTQLHGAQLVVAVQVRPSPQAAVDDMGEPLPMGHLQSAIQGPARMRRGRNETVMWTWLAFSEVLPAAAPSEFTGQTEKALSSPPFFQMHKPQDQRTADC